MVSFPNSECFRYAPPGTAVPLRVPSSLPAQTEHWKTWNHHLAGLFVTFNHGTDLPSFACSAFSKRIQAWPLTSLHPHLAGGHTTQESSSTIPGRMRQERSRCTAVLDMQEPAGTELLQGHLFFPIIHSLTARRKLNCFWIDVRHDKDAAAKMSSTYVSFIHAMLVP